MRTVSLQTILMSLLTLTEEILFKLAILLDLLLKESW